MDAYALTKGIEMFTDSTNSKPEETPAPEPYTARDTVSLFISLCIGFYAAYLSWDCNTAVGYSVPSKVFFAFFAFFFGLIYLIFYLIFRAGTCGSGGAVNQPAALAAPAPAPAAAPALPAIPKLGGFRAGKSLRKILKQLSSN